MAGIKWTNGGLAIVTNRIIGSGTEPKYVGWGTGTTNPTTSNTDLETPSNEARVSGTGTRVTTTATNDTYQVAGTITSAGSQAITEVGTFDAAGSGTPPSGGNLNIRATFAAINVAASDSIAFTIKLAFASA